MSPTFGEEDEEVKREGKRKSIRIFQKVNLNPVRKIIGAKIHKHSKWLRRDHYTC